ncbi:MAG: phosphomannomutase/phosphoglucomutase [bacterium]|nr:phosphomannomutase/phosphoglucomutase [bacterium]
MNIDPTIFRSYDIRGIYPSQINRDIAYKIAQAYCKFVNPQKVVLGRDVRTSGPELFEAMKQGLLDHGVDVADIGVVSTDMMYFAVANYDYDGGLTVTASHNPKEYNGCKIVRKGGKPISSDSGIFDIRDIVLNGYKFKSEAKAKLTQLDTKQDYIDKILSFIDIGSIKPFKLLANTNFGTAGAALRLLEKKLPLELTVLNEEPNGEFPKGRPDPLIPSNRDEIITALQAGTFDLGVMWDSDADRVFFLDETGRFLSGYFTSAVLAEYFLQKYPKSKVIVDMKLNWAIIDTVKRAGGIALGNKTGHSYFKERMIAEQAVFGGEISGHYFFKDFFYLDNGMIPLVIILEILSRTGQKLSQIYQPYFDKYFAIDETNVPVKDIAKTIEFLKGKYVDAKQSFIDGISLEYPNWRANVRLAANEPLIRLNVEAKDPETLKQKTQELLKLIRTRF